MNSFRLVGGSYTARSTNFDAQKTINFYPEASGSGASKSIAMLVGTPGLTLWATLNDFPVRGALRVNDTLSIWVAGGTVYRADTLGNTAVIGSIVRDVTPVSMAFNGFQMFLVTGAFGYFIDLASLTVTQITTDSFVGADKVVFIDGYFVFNTPGTQKFQITSLFGTTIDALDFALAEGAPDVLRTLEADHRELWLFGATSTQVFVNTGNADFPFEQIQGAFIEQGCAAKNSVAKLDNTLVWLAEDDRGQGTVQRARGYVPERISDHALEFAIGGYPYIADAVGYAYQQEGHMFYMLTFPTAQATWCFDATTGLWHERAYRNVRTGTLEQHRSICHIAFAGKHLVGDRENGNIYFLDLNNYTDNGAVLPAIRQAPHIASAGNVWNFFTELWVDMETAPSTLLVGQGSDPEVMLTWSDDGGKVFSSERRAKLGQTGQRQTRVRFTRLGKARDRVWRLMITDPVKRVLIDGQVNYYTGTQ